MYYLASEKEVPMYATTLHREVNGEWDVGNHKQSLRTVGVMANRLWIGKITHALR